MNGIDNVLSKVIALMKEHKLIRKLMFRGSWYYVIKGCFSHKKVNVAYGIWKIVIATNLSVHFRPHVDISKILQVDILVVALTSC